MMFTKPVTCYTPRRLLAGLLLLFLAGGGLTGCASQQDYMQSLQAYNGIGEGALIDKFGVPDRTYDVDGRKYLSFVTRHTNAYPVDSGFSGGFGRNRSVFSTGVSTGTSYYTTECENVFVIYHGVVERSGFKGQCY